VSVTSVPASRSAAADERARATSGRTMHRAVATERVNHGWVRAA
jgi:hypothetical protein